MRSGTRLIVAVLFAALLVAGCEAPPEAGPAEVASPFAACPAPLGAADSEPTGATGSEPSGATGSEPSGATGSEPSGGAARALPAVGLPCFTGGEQVTLSDLGQPMVINFWASYCQPCRKELPELQRFADAVEGRVLMIGVVTTDSRAAAASLGEDFGVRFPSVFDADGALRRALGHTVLPVTLFVDAQGRIRHEDLSGALTEQRVADLAAEHLGVQS